MNLKHAVHTLSVVALFIGVAGAAVPLDHHAFNGSGKSMEELEAEGYSCGKVVAGFWTCTKGRSTYYCRQNVCEEASSAAGVRPGRDGRELNVRPELHQRQQRYAK